MRSLLALALGVGRVGLVVQLAACSGSTALDALPPDAGVDRRTDEPDAPAGCGAPPGWSCASGTRDACSDGLRPPVCDPASGRWGCGPDLIPSTECRCFGRGCVAPTPPLPTCGA